MDEEDVVINADASGGVEAFQSMGVAVQNFHQDMDNIKTDFAQSFEHVGLHLFTSNLMSSIGMTGEARVAYMGLSAVMAAVSGVFELSAGTLAPFVIALGAAALIWKEFSGSAANAGQAVQDHEQAVQSDLTAQESATASYKDAIGSLDAYAASVGALPPKLADLKAALEAGLGASTQASAHDIGVQMGDLQTKILATKDTMSDLTEKIALDRLAQSEANQGTEQGAAEWAKAGNAIVVMGQALDSAKDKLAAQQAQLATLKADLPYVAEGYKSAGDYAQQMADAATAAYKANLKSIDDIIAADEAEMQALDETGAAADAAAEKQTRAAEQIAAGITALAAQQQQYAAQDIEITGDEWSQKTAKVAEASAKQEEALDKYYAKLLEDARKSGADTTAITAQYEAAKVQLAQTSTDQQAQVLRSFVGINQNLYQSMEAEGSSVFKSLATGFGNAVGQMVVQGKSFSDSMQKVFTSMEEAFISKVAEMTAQWLAFMALQGVAGMFSGGGASLGSLSGVGMMGGAPGASLSGVGGIPTNFLQGLPPTGSIPVPTYAGGVDTILSSPTLLIAGEAGEERLQITPQKGGGSPPAAAGGGGGSGGISVTFGDIHLHGVQDPQSLANQLLPYIAQAIKGRGQVGLTGPGLFGG